MTECTVDGCDSAGDRRGWCTRHYMRWWRHGDPVAGRKYEQGENNPLWRGDDVGNPAMHRRVVKAKGSAKGYDCVDCGGQAKHWSYDHADPNERRDDQGPYGLSVDHYEPRCVSCHKKFDLRRSDV